jgi:hypothetical protein
MIGSFDVKLGAGEIFPGLLKVMQQLGFFVPGSHDEDFPTETQRFRHFRQKLPVVGSIARTDAAGLVVEMVCGGVGMHDDLADAAAAHREDFGGQVINPHHRVRVLDIGGPGVGFAHLISVLRMVSQPATMTALMI